MNIFASPAEAAAACATEIVARLLEAVARDGRATLAISGGNSPKSMFQRIAVLEMPWDKIHIFWVDERAVPKEDPQSNYRMARESLIRPAGIPDENVHRIHGELEPAEAARKYAEDLRAFFGDGIPKFDIVHRGMGADAHTASLFPGEPLIADRSGIAAPVYVQKLKQWRITLLPAPLLAAKHAVVLAAGADKAEALRAVFSETFDPLRWPAQLGAKEALWYVDSGAAALI